MVRTNPSNLQATFGLVTYYMQTHQTNRVIEVLDRTVSSPAVVPDALAASAQFYSDMLQWSKAETTLEKLVKIAPNSPEAWFNLANLKATLTKNSEALVALSNSMRLNSDRLKVNPKEHDLSADARKSEYFSNLRQLPEFNALLAPK